MTIAPLRASAAAMNRSFPLPPPMRRALDLAAIAAEAGEVPVGAVVTRDGEIIAEARNAMRGQVDPTAHAEMVAIRLAATRLDSPRLDGCELWVTLEPCAMCAAAISLARIGKLNFAAEDPKGRRRAARRAGVRAAHLPSSARSPLRHRRGRSGRAAAGFLRRPPLAAERHDLDLDPAVGRLLHVGVVRIVDRRRLAEAAGRHAGVVDAARRQIVRHR